MAIAKLNFVPQKKGKHWTDDEIDTLKTMRAQGHTVPEIAVVLNRPVSATYFFARKHSPARFDRATYTAKEDTLLKACVEANMFDHEIVERMPGRSKSSIRERMSVLGLIEGRSKRLRDRQSKEAAQRRLEKGLPPPRPSGARKVDPDDLRRRTQRGETVRDIAKALRVRQTRLRKIAEEQGFSLIEPPKRIKERTPEAQERARKQRELEAAVVEAAKTMTVTQAARTLGKNIRTVKRIAEKMGVSFKKAVSTSRIKAEPQKAKPKPKTAPKQRIKRKDVPVEKPKAKELTAFEKEERRRMIRDIALRMQAQRA